LSSFFAPLSYEVQVLADVVGVDARDGHRVHVRLAWPSRALGARHLEGQLFASAFLSVIFGWFPRAQ
jgi:hypothetical protein